VETDAILLYSPRGSSLCIRMEGETH
jgi:hypothetical protein